MNQWLFTTMMLLVVFVERILTKETEDVVCRALCLSGGGDHGAYEFVNSFSVDTLLFRLHRAGVLKGLTEDNQTDYEIIVGTSIGAINAGVFGQYPRGSDRESAINLVNVWSKISSKSFYSSWPGGIVEGLFKKGLYNTDCARKTYDLYLNKTMLQHSGRKVYFAATDLKDGSLTLFDESVDDLFSVIRASSAIAGLFPPVTIGDRHFVDGGFCEANTPISTAIRECEKRYYPGVKIHVDVTQDIAREITPSMLDKLESLDILLKTILNLMREFLDGDIAHARSEWPNATIRVVHPSKVLPGVYLGFKHLEIMEMIHIGYEDGKRAAMLS